MSCVSVNCNQKNLGSYSKLLLRIFFFFNIRKPKLREVKKVGSQDCMARHRLQYRLVVFNLCSFYHSRFLWGLFVEKAVFFAGSNVLSLSSIVTHSRPNRSFSLRYNISMKILVLCQELFGGDPEMVLSTYFTPLLSKTVISAQVTCQWVEPSSALCILCHMLIVL